MRIKLLLVLLISTLIVSGCGNGQYSIERRYWYLQKKAQNILINPEGSPPKELIRVVGLLDNFAKKYPKNVLGVSAEFSIANLYLAKKEFPRARAQLQRIITKYKNADRVCSEALFLIGKSYELDDNWSQALVKYQEVISRYGNTARGFNLPLYIAQHYKIKYQPDKMIAAYNDAALHYTGLMQAHPNTQLGYAASMLAIQAKLAVKNYQGILDTLNLVIAEFKNPDVQAEALGKMTSLYLNAFKDISKAKETLKRLIRDYPKSKLVNNAQKFLKELEKK